MNSIRYFFLPSAYSTCRVYAHVCECKGDEEYDVHGKEGCMRMSVNASGMEHMM